MRAKAFLVTTWAALLLGALAPGWATEPAAEPLTLSSIVLPADALPAGCTLIEGIYAVSGQARAQYTDDFAGAVTGAKPVAKQFQSMRCDKAAGTVFYYQYATDADAVTAVGFIQTLVWGQKKPSSMHPEMIDRWKNIVVVVSFRHPQAIATPVMVRLSGSSSVGNKSTADKN